jgi:hypothetical protein
LTANEGKASVIRTGASPALQTPLRVCGQRARIKVIPKKKSKLDIAMAWDSS